MDYEKAYKESFEAAKGLHDAGNALTKKQMEIVFPQLAESEDERIRKEIVAAVEMRGDLTQGRKSEIYAYLEKQKERGPLTKEEEYILHRIIEYLEDETCPSEWISLLHDIYCLPYEKQKEPHFTKRNALFDKCVENCDPEIMKRVSDEVDAMLQKEQKSVQSNVEREYVRTLKSLISDFLRGKEDVDREYYQQIFDWLDGRHIEQKPAEVDESTKRLNENWMKQHFDDYKEQKPAEWILPEEFEEAVYKVANFISPFDSQEELRKVSHRFAEQLLSLAKKELDKPAEWSEDDEETLKDIIAGLEATKQLTYRHEPSGRACYNRWIAWLKSIPERFNLQPKPTEWNERYIADVFENVGLAKIVREQGNDELTNAVQSAMIELSKGNKQEWSEEDEKMIDDIIRALPKMSEAEDNILPEILPSVARKYIERLKSLRSLHKRDGGDDYKKGYTEGYNKGYKDANESVSYHFPVMPTTPSGFSCDGTHCTNPHMDCINCPIKTTGGINTVSSSGYLTLKAEWKPSEEQMKALLKAVDKARELHYTSIDGYPGYNDLRSLYEQLKKLM